MNYANIIHGDMVNGEDYGIAFFPCGCTMKCNGCHNESIWDKNAGIPFDKNAKDEIFNALNKDYNHRFSFVGGHVFEDFNIEECTQLAKEIRQLYPNVKIWCYTGRLYENVKDLEIMQYIDVLCDGPFVLSLKEDGIKWVGSSNQRVIDVQQSIDKNEIVLYTE